LTPKPANNPVVTQSGGFHMKLVKSLLLGSAAALVAGAGAQAADLPARKAAPVEYVKVCDAYGAGFFFIPGTDTCIKVGGRVRADYAMSSRGTIYSGGTINGTTGARINTISLASGSENIYGWEARGRVDLDARTQTPYGTVQAVASLRLARTTGVLNASGPGLSSASASPTLEAAYIRFAGFTFGAARDNFAFMPSTFYGSGHWASFANGAKQIAYTAVLGGGLSATVAIQDLTDTAGSGIAMCPLMQSQAFSCPAPSSRLAERLPDCSPTNRCRSLMVGSIGIRAGVRPPSWARSAGSTRPTRRAYSGSPATRVLTKPSGLSALV
jgi:hypothetical protein